MEELLKNLNLTENDLRIKLDDFIATKYKYDGVRKVYFSECFELVDGHWEGFISLQESLDAPVKSKSFISKPNLIPEGAS